MRVATNDPRWTYIWQKLTADCGETVNMTELLSKMQELGISPIRDVDTRWIGINLPIDTDEDRVLLMMKIV